jgi:virginiamycin B lyase
MIGRITIHGAITEYSGVSPGSEPACIVAGPDGNMWFTEYRGNRMGRVNLH